MNIVIQKATLNGIFLSYDFEQKDVDSNNLMKVKSDVPVHDDLRNAFKNFIPHFAFICEQVSDENLVKKAIENPALYLKDKENAPDISFFKYHVHTIQHNTKKGNNKIIISGCRQVGELLEQVCFCTPEIDLDDSSYKFHTQLNEHMELWKEEVIAYMEGKQSPKTQMEMFSETDEEEVSEEEGAFVK